MPESIVKHALATRGLCRLPVDAPTLSDADIPHMRLTILAGSHLRWLFRFATGTLRQHCKSVPLTPAGGTACPPSLAKQTANIMIEGQHPPCAVVTCLTRCFAKHAHGAPLNRFLMDGTACFYTGTHVIRVSSYFS